MFYIAILDYKHLDQSFFMNAFAEAMTRQKGCSGIIVHGDSPYTERLIQTGMMRNQAIIRATKDLNHRIVALLADKGIPGTGINGYQKDIVQQKDNHLIIEKEWIDARPAGTHLVLSNLIRNNITGDIHPVPLSLLTRELSRQLQRKPVILFVDVDADNVFVNKNKSTQDNDKGNIRSRVPADLNPPPENSYLCSVMAFGDLPDTSTLEKLSS
ncbi:MAG: hypothetical protein WD097_00780 [Balneolales bacterium]